MRAGAHPIERASYEILRQRVDLGGLPPLTRAVAERVVHATADASWAGELLTTEAELAAGLAALRAGAPLVADVGMTAAGITARPARCFLADPRVPAMAAAAGSRSAAAIRVAAAEVGPGAIWVIGCAPTALVEVLRSAAEPAFVVGLPVGFVGAVEAKAALRAGALPGVSNRGERGGAAVAAAVVNALLYAGGSADPGPGSCVGGP